MGFFDELLGNASEVELPKLKEELAPILGDHERLEKAFKEVRDLFIFTDKRLLLVDKQGLTGAKTQYLSIPYRSILRFSVETAGTFDMDAELKLWLSGVQEPLTKEFKKGSNILDVQRVLATFVLK